MFTSIEICAGAGGQAVGLHEAGFGHLALVEIDPNAVKTLELNIEIQRVWPGESEYCSIVGIDVNDFDPYNPAAMKQKSSTAVIKKKSIELLQQHGLDLLAGGVPCPPFSHAGKQLGKDDERDLFPRMLELVKILKPRAVMIENVRGLMDPKFEDYRNEIKRDLRVLGYSEPRWEILEAANFGVPQLRPRAILVAFRKEVIGDLVYQLPKGNATNPVSVLKSLKKSMKDRFEPYFDGDRSEEAREAFKRWHTKARNRDIELKGKGGGIAPTLVGGSKKHGGADLGPSRAKAAWKQLGISGMGVANDIKTCAEKGTEDRDLFGPDGPMLTVRQAAIIQGFPIKWDFYGGKTAQYRQVGNAFPPPVAKAVGQSIIEVLKVARERDEQTSEPIDLAAHRRKRKSPAPTHSQRQAKSKPVASNQDQFPLWSTEDAQAQS